MKKRIISLLTVFVMLTSLCFSPAVMAVTVDPANMPVLTLTTTQVGVSNLAESWVLLVASYDARGNIISESRVNLSAGPDYSAMLTSLGIDVTVATKVKAFVWKDLNDIQSAVDSKEVTYVDPGSPSRPGGGGISYYILTLVDGETESKNKYAYGTEVDLVELAGTKDGYVLEGFYLDKEFTQKIESPYEIKKSVTIYVKRTQDSDSPFIKDKHFAYIIGYPSENGSKEVRPENNISREEIATIFYRLVKDEVRQQYYTTSNPFSDVEADRWSNEYISTIANGKFILGDTEGTFRPEDFITRAEFVTIASRFFNHDGADIIDSKFTDVSGHWGERFISYAVGAGWINGYEDGTFRPDAYITRAETMKIINAILERRVDKDGLVDGYIKWDDNFESKWYYYEVIEATNDHNYERANSSDVEKWTEIVR